MGEQFQRVRTLFEASLEIAVTERLRWLREQCGDDAELERDVRALLEAHDESGALLDQAIVLDEAEDRPASLGPYEVLEEIGRGGMGAVYRAVRNDDTFQKIVAIKVMGNVFQPGLTARFQRERQILARLEHPNIARILDGGTANGVPYLVMEYVEGERIDEYSARRNLDIRSRLELFIQLCQAVDYTHRNLVVHRDLKPANVLVTANGTVKLLDFGIAKLMEDEGAGGVTRTLQMTPDYASPEQLRGEPVGVSSDVYSLGVILYQLLTGGARPRTVSGINLAELIQAASTGEPPAPSVKAPAAVRSQLRGDLDSIVLTALAIDSGRRYSSAARLGDDVQRYLDGLPVWAHADTLTYRGRKFATRHWASLTIAVVVGAALVSAAVISIREARIAERRYQDVRALATTVLFDIHDKIRTLPGASEARRLTVTKALYYLDALSKQSQNDVALQAELAAAYERAGSTLGDISDVSLEGGQAALPLFQKSLHLRQQLFDRNRANTAAREALASAYERLGVAQLGMGSAKEALASFEAGVALATPGSLAHVQLLTRVSSSYAMVNDLPKALTYCEPAVTLAKSPTSGWTQEARDKMISRTYRQCGILLSMAGRNKEAIPVLQLASDTLSKLVRDNPQDVNNSRLLATMLPFLAKVYDDSGQPRDAMKILLNSRSQLLEMAKRSPTDPQVVLTLTFALKRLAAASYRDKTGDLGYADSALALEHTGRLAANPKAGFFEVSEYADTLLTVPFPKLQDNRKALQAALRGNELSRSQNPSALQILATAYFRNGDTRTAIATMEKGLALIPAGAKTPLRAEMEDALKKFRARQ